MPPSSCCTHTFAHIQPSTLRAVPCCAELRCALGKMPSHQSPGSERSGTGLFTPTRRPPGGRCCGCFLAREDGFVVNQTQLLSELTPSLVASSFTYEEEKVRSFANEQSCGVKEVRSESPRCFINNPHPAAFGSLG